MLFNTPMILAYVIAALAVPALTNAAALGNDTALASASPDDVAPPTCYGQSQNNIAASCTQYIDAYCATISPITFKAGNVQNFCYGGLVQNNNTKYKCGFFTKNTNVNQDGKPNLANCKAVLQNIATRCQYGGYGRFSETEKTAFRFGFNATPQNSGVC